MPLSVTTQVEIQGEIDRLIEVIEKAEARKAALVAVLEPFSLTPPQVTPKPVVQTVNFDRTVQEAFLRVQPLHAGTGLRAAIVTVLRVHGPMRAPDVARKLAAEGFQNTSKTKLPIRVYNDLWRMIEPGIVVNKNGVFSLKEST